MISHKYDFKNKKTQVNFTSLKLTAWAVIMWHLSRIHTFPFTSFAPLWQCQAPYAHLLSLSQAKKWIGSQAVTCVWSSVGQPRPSPGDPQLPFTLTLPERLYSMSSKLPLSQRSRFILPRVGEIPLPLMEANYQPWLHWWVGGSGGRRGSLWYGSVV